MKSIDITQFDELIKETVSHYIDADFSYDTNLLGISPVRNIIYILLELEHKIGLKIDMSLIDGLQVFSISNLANLAKARESTSASKPL